MSALIAVTLASVALSGVSDAYASHAHRSRTSRMAKAVEDTPLGLTTTFAYKQRKFLFSRNADGGLAYIPARADRSGKLPLVVFLHGLNPEEQMHPWVNGREGDLRLVADKLVREGDVESFVLAAPTHTRFATGTKAMWPNFDLADFVSETERALTGRVNIDTSRVILVGHSGAGCNPNGGILGKKATMPNLLARVVVDTCMTPEIESALAALPGPTQLRVYWQPSWERSFDELRASCETRPGACKIEQIDAPGKVPHNTILPIALTRALTELIPASAPRRIFASLSSE